MTVSSMWLYRPHSVLLWQSCLIVRQELDISEQEAETRLRECRGDALEVLRAYVAVGK